MREWKCNWSRFRNNRSGYSNFLFHPEVAGFQYGHFRKIKVTMTKYVLGPGASEKDPLFALATLIA